MTETNSFDFADLEATGPAKRDMASKVFVLISFLTAAQGPRGFIIGSGYRPSWNTPNVAPLVNLDVPGIFPNSHHPLSAVAEGAVRMSPGNCAPLLLPAPQFTPANSPYRYSLPHTDVKTFYTQASNFVPFYHPPVIHSPTVLPIASLPNKVLEDVYCDWPSMYAPTETLGSIIYLPSESPQPCKCPKCTALLCCKTSPNTGQRSPERDASTRQQSDTPGFRWPACNCVPNKPSDNSPQQDVMTATCRPSYNPPQYDFPSTTCRPSYNPPQYDFPSYTCRPSDNPPQFDFPSSTCRPSYNPPQYDFPITSRRPSYNPPQFDFPSSTRRPSYNLPQLDFPSYTCRPSNNPPQFDFPSSTRRPPSYPPQYDVPYPPSETYFPPQFDMPCPPSRPSNYRPQFDVSSPPSSASNYQFDTPYLSCSPSNNIPQFDVHQYSNDQHSYSTQYIVPNARNPTNNHVQYDMPRQPSAHANNNSLQCDMLCVESKPSVNSPQFDFSSPLNTLANYPLRLNLPIPSSEHRTSMQYDFSNFPDMSVSYSVGGDVHSSNRAPRYNPWFNRTIPTNRYMNNPTYFDAHRTSSDTLSQDTVISFSTPLPVPNTYLSPSRYYTTETSRHSASSSNKPENLSVGSDSPLSHWKTLLS